MNKRLGRLLPPRHAVTNFLSGRAEVDEFDPGGRLPANVLAENRNTKAGGDVLDCGPCPIDFLHHVRSKSAPLAKSCQPGAIAGCIFSRGQNEPLTLQLTESDKRQIRQCMI